MPTPNDSSLRTGWICIATEGKSVDGRDITRQWLIDMAETYDPEFYTALLWPEHDRWTNVGAVEALKTIEEDGVLKLYAVLRPTRDLIYYNQIGQYRFCSVEIVENFAGIGRAYLYGLGVTDQPASTGTTEMKFSSKHTGHQWAAPQPLDLSEFKAGRKPGSLLDKFFNLLATHGGDQPAESHPPHSQVNDEEEEMKPEQFNQMIEAFTSLGTKLDAVAGKVEAFSAKPDEKPEAKPEVKPEVTDADQFKQLADAMTGMAAKLDGVVTKINEFSAELPNQRPSPLGGADNEIKLV